MEEDRVNGERYSVQFKYINSKEKELLYEEESFKIFRTSGAGTAEIT